MCRWKYNTGFELTPGREAAFLVQDNWFEVDFDF